MIPTRIYIFAQSRGWSVCLNGETMRLCATKTDAARLAIKAAMALTPGHDAEIYLDGDEHSAVPFWCSGGVPSIH